MSDNDHLVLISGKSGTGKSASLLPLAQNSDGTPVPADTQARVLYLCTEAGKKLPFNNKFTSHNIIDPLQVEEALEHVIDNPGDFDCVVIDSQTFLMDQYESQYVLGSADTMKGWSNFQQYFKKLVQHYVPQIDCPVIFTAHTMDVLNEAEMSIETKVPVKGALKNNGIESLVA